MLIIQKSVCGGSGTGQDGDPPGPDATFPLVSFHKLQSLGVPRSDAGAQPLGIDLYTHTHKHTHRAVTLSLSLTEQNSASLGDSREELSQSGQAARPGPRV